MNSKLKVELIWLRKEYTCKAHIAAAMAESAVATVVGVGVAVTIDHQKKLVRF